MSRGRLKLLPGSACFLLAVLVTAAHAAPAEMTLPARVALRALISLTEAELTATAQLLRVIAASDAAGKGDWDKLAPLLAEAQKPVPALVWYAHPDGSYRAVGTDTTGQTLKDRPYFARLLAGEAVLGDLIVGKVSRRCSVVVAVPVVREGKVLGAVGASVYLDELSRRLNAVLRLPAGWGLWALDATGTITTVHPYSERLFADPGKVGNDSLRQAVKTMRQKRHGLLTYTFEGRTSAVVYEQSDLLGWTFVLDSPKP